MKIHQLSVNYLAEQDRILARINTAAAEEIRMWFTRRLMVGLWPLLSRMVTQHLLRLESAGRSLDAADDDLKRMLADFRKEEFLKDADFNTPYKDEQVTFPLGPKPLLVTDVDVTPLASGRLRMVFNEKRGSTGDPRNFQVELDPKLMQGLVHLMDQALERSRWREAFEAPVAAPEAPASPDDTTPRKPRYLN